MIFGWLLAVPFLAHAAAEIESTNHVSGAYRGNVTDVWVVFKTHFDLGYTDLVTNVLKRYREEFMDRALGLIESNQGLAPDQRFVWTVPGWPLTHMLGPLQTPERRARIEAAIRAGALAVHALPFTCHTESLELEDLVRGLHFSSELDRRYGLPLARSAKLTDVPEHCWVLPTVLKHAGIDFLHVGCNSASSGPRFPRLFYWEGPDGSRLLCNYSPGYGEDVIPPEDWPARNYLAMIVANDNQGPPSAAEIAELRERARRKLPGIKLHCGTLDDFLRAIESEKPELPIVRGDTPDTWIHGLMAMPQASGVARVMRPLEPALDSLDTHLKLNGLNPPPLALSLAAAYENSLLYAEHTWGLSGQFGHCATWPLAQWKREVPPQIQERFLQSFDDHAAYIRTADEIVNRELQLRLKQLATSVRGPGSRLLVWNALPWERNGHIEVGGRELHVVNVPPNGYLSFPANFVVAPVETDTFYTPFYRVTFDLQRGGISSLVEKKTERELVDPASPYVLGQFLHERFSRKEVEGFFRSYSRMAGGWALSDFGKPGMPDTSYQAVSPGAWKLSVRHSPFTDVATLTAGDTKGLAKACTLKFTFSRYNDSVEVEWVITEKTPDKTPEGGWLCFPFAVEQPEFALGRLGGMVNPAADIIVGAGRHLYAVNAGVSISGINGQGVSLCPLDSPLLSLDRPGLWLYEPTFVPHRPSVFVNLYNNKWNTNFPLWQEGSWSERVAFWPGKNLVVRAWEKRVPLIAIQVDAPPGNLPQKQSGLGVSREGVLVTAFGANPDGAGTLLRMWEQNGVSGEVVVTLPGQFQSAAPVDLRGEPAGRPLVVKDGKIKIGLRAYAPASFVLQ